MDETPRRTPAAKTEAAAALEVWEYFDIKNGNHLLSS